MFIPIIAMFAIMYFLMIRPQMKQQKQQEEFLSKLKPGDEVVTRAGFMGKILELKSNPEVAVLEVGEGSPKVKIPVLKAQIAALTKQLEIKDKGAK